MRSPGARGFTLIEIIAAITLISLIMIPIALMTIEYVRSIAYAETLARATNAINKELAAVNNSSYASVSTATLPNYDNSGFDLRLTVNVVGAGKEVVVAAYGAGSNEKVFESVTYIANISYGAGGGMVSSSFTASGGSMPRTPPHRAELYDITLTNLNGSNSITAIGVAITSNRARRLVSASLGGIVCYAGSLNLARNVETQVLFQNNFAMAPGAAYAGNQGGIFVFNNNNAIGNSITLKFIFNDGSKSSSYSWTTP